MSTAQAGVHDRTGRGRTRRTTKRPDHALPPSLADQPSQLARVLYVDPPWKYHVWDEPKPLKKHNGYSAGKRVAAAHFPTMSIEELSALPVGQLADPKRAAIFMWATMPVLDDPDDVMGDAFDLMRAWGFKYRTVAFTWVKLNKATGKPWLGLGHYTRGNAELCLLGIRGSMRRRETPEARKVSSIILEPKREHSRKPDCTYGRITTLFDGPYTEAFARQPWPGWQTAFSNQDDKFLGQPLLWSETDLGAVRARQTVA